MDDGTWRRGARAWEGVTPGLRDADGQIRLVCAGHLQKLGPHAVAALPELDRLAASDPDVWIQAAAKMAAEVIRRERGK